MGAAFLAACVSILVNKSGRWAALLLAILFLLRLLVAHVPMLFANIHDPSPWTSGGEVMSMCGGLLFLAGTLPGDPSPGGRLMTIGRLVFALPMPIFGIQHLLYVAFVATLVPSWIPGHLFWAYFTGTAHIAAGLSIAAHFKTRISATLLGLMFFCGS
jgi:uncharacterized membrane protein YphA (DoxX/SURF4 family)